MRTILTVVVLIGAAAPTQAISQQSDTLCDTVMTKKERARLLEGKDMGELERDGFPDDPYAAYRKAKEIGNMRDAWFAIILAQEGTGAHPDLQRADRLWKDYWCSQVLPAFEDKPEYAWNALQTSAAREFPSAMLRISEAYAKGEFGQSVDVRLSQEWKAKYEAVRNRRTSGGSCGELSAREIKMLRRTCKNAYQHPDPEKEGFLRLGYISNAVLQHLAIPWEQRDGVFGLRTISRLSHSTCSRFFEDLIHLRNMRVVVEGESQWKTFRGAMRTLPNTDPYFKEWTHNGNRYVQGYVVIDWNSTRYLVRAYRVCAGPQAPETCSSVTFAHLDVHDALGPPIACSTEIGWRGEGLVTPLRLSIDPLRNKQ